MNFEEILNLRDQQVMVKHLVELLDNKFMPTREQMDLIYKHDMYVFLTKRALLKEILKYGYLLSQEELDTYTLYIPLEYVFKNNLKITTKIFNRHYQFFLNYTDDNYLNYVAEEDKEEILKNLGEIKKLDEKTR